MTFEITYPVSGRGSFPINGSGGTLNVTGTALGPYYRSPAIGSSVKMPGLTAALAVRYGTPCDINDYAVWSAVKALQPYFGATADGILGPKTDAAIRAYQTDNGLWVDGVIGPATSKSLFKPLAVAACTILDKGHLAMVQRAVIGTITLESLWDAGSVGLTTPQDLGIGQINGPAHPDLSVDDRLNPGKSIMWVASFIDANFKYFKYSEDVSIASYNLGRGGATSWVKAGRPEFFHGTNVWEYVRKIKLLGT